MHETESILEEMNTRGHMQGAQLSALGRADAQTYKGMYLFLLLYLAIEFLRPQFWVPAIGVIRPALIATLVLFFFSMTNLRHEVFKETGVRALIGLALLCIFSMTYATNTYWALQSTLLMFAHVFAFIIPFCIIVNSPDRLQAFATTWLLIHCYLAIFGITHGGRGPGSFLTDENDLALALNVALPFAYFLRASPTYSAGWKLLCTATCILVVTAVVFTFSRGGFVGLSVTTAAIIWMSRNRVRNIILVMLGAAVLWAAAPADYKSEMSTIGDTEENTAAGRLYQWERGWEMYVDNPVLGVGSGNYPWRVAEYELLSGELAPNGRLHGGRAAHSFYFTLLPELGTIGAALFLVSLFRSARAIRLTIKREREKSSLTTAQTFEELFARATMVAMVGYLSTGIFISVLYYPQFWYLVGFSIVVNWMSIEKWRSKSNAPATVKSTGNGEHASRK